jgi:peptidoglycan/xylan/chitin deacetylase (PgdA/CDA1 family)
MKGFRKRLFNMSFKTGFTHLKQRYLSRRPVTILGYHQIETPDFMRRMMGWDMTPKAFQAQLEYIAANYTVLSGQQLETCIIEEGVFPENALAITFDDGYRDVYNVAFPILKRLGLPATVFLTTGSLDNECSLWTNVIYHYFYRTGKNYFHLVFPDGSRLDGHWSSEAEKRPYVLQVNRKMKTVSNADRLKAMSALAATLEVAAIEDPYDRMPMLTWNMVRELVQSKIFSLGAHTVNHPILSRCTVEEQHREMQESRNRIEHETGIVCRYFAYPNGQVEDYTDRTGLLAKEIGYTLAFTFWSGRPDESIRAMEIPRHPILTSDLAEFAWNLR